MSRGDTRFAGTRDVLVVGDVNLDILVRPERPIERGTDVAADVRQRPGGAGANVAIGLGRLGRSATLAGCIGADDSTTVTDLLRTAGVRSALRAIKGARTGTIVAIIGPDGERSMASDRGANLALVTSDLPVELIAQHRHLHLSGYTLFQPRTRAAALAAVGLAIGLGRTVSIDPASVAPLRDYGTARFLSDIEGIDLLLPNAEEALSLSGRADVEQAASTLADSVPLVAVTCGAGGALWADQRSVHRRPAVVSPDEVVDTTGGGDAFTAGFLAAWVAGRPPTDCVDAGQQAAGEVVIRWGAQ